jgi:hypothetical protein
MAADITVTFTPAEAEMVKKAIEGLQRECAAAAVAVWWTVLERAHKKIVAVEVTND